MNQAIHVVLRSPGLVLLTCSSLLVIIGILLNTWTERKRERHFRQLAERSRLNNLGFRPTASAMPAASAMMSKKAEALANVIPNATRSELTPEVLLGTFLRRPGLWMAGIAFAALLVTLRWQMGSQTVHARTLPESQIMPSAPAPASVRSPVLALSPAFIAHPFAPTNRVVHPKTPVDFSTAHIGHFDVKNDSGSWFLDESANPSAQIDISAPMIPVGDLKAPTTPSWGKVKLIRSKAPAPPVQLQLEQ
jgi:hypothetical protein